MIINRDKFWGCYREVFGAIKKPTTVDSVNAMLAEFEKNAESIKPVEKYSYMLATVRHEVGADMLPISENMNYSSAKRIMQVWPSRFPTLASAQPYVNRPRELGNKVYGGRLGNGLLEGYKYRGRGSCAQITGYINYKKFSELFDVDLINNPDLLLTDYKLNAKILYTGMMTKRACKVDNTVCYQSSFTGLTLSQFINEGATDYYNARAVVNADKQRVGADIANVAKKFEGVFRGAIL